MLVCVTKCVADIRAFVSASGHLCMLGVLYFSKGMAVWTKGPEF